MTELDFSTAYVARKIRNVFAHESTSAASEAWTLVADPEAELPPALRVTGRTKKFNIDGWRGYMLESPDKKPRVQVFHENLTTLAEMLKK